MLLVQKSTFLRVVSPEILPGEGGGADSANKSAKSGSFIFFTPSLNTSRRPQLGIGILNHKAKQTNKAFCI